jgi:hypothetical protein
LSAAREGFYDWNIARNTIHYSERVHSYLGLPPGTLETTHYQSVRNFAGRPLRNETRGVQPAVPDEPIFGSVNVGAQPPGATSTGTNGPSGTAGSSGLRLLARSMSILASSSSSRRRLTSALHERSTFWI